MGSRSHDAARRLLNRRADFEDLVRSTEAFLNPDTPMDGPMGTRREFLSASAMVLGGSWLSMHLPMVESLAAWARTAASQGATLTILTPDEARTMEAFASQIIPSDATSPGAKEAGAVWFIDRALGPGYFPEFGDVVKAGIVDLDGRARRRRRGVASFADLTSADQIALMRQVQETPSFNVARMLSVMGTLSDPRHGGNRNHVSTQILGIEHQPSYQPPFGYYDAEAARRSSGGSQ
jgi:gluconate 2-dehydrogenase gamma chain